MTLALAFSAYCLASEPTTKSFPAKTYPFLPQLFVGSDNPVCQIVEAVYRDQFKSNAVFSTWTSTNLSEGNNWVVDPAIDGFQWAQWTPVTAEDIYGDLFVASAFLTDRKERLYLHRSTHSWRGDNYVIYLVDPTIEPAFLDSLKLGSKGVDSLGRQATEIWPSNIGSNWHLNNVFRFHDAYYFLDEPGRFSDNKGMRSVYRLLPNGSVDKVCQLLVNQELDVTSSEGELPAVSAFVESLEQVSGPAIAYCGTLNAHYSAKLSAREAASRLLLRPWHVLGDEYPRQTWGGAYTTDQAVALFLSDWALDDVWTQREAGVLSSARSRAQTELTTYYIKAFGLNGPDAAFWAERNIAELVSAYFVIPSSYLKFRKTENLTIRTKITTGDPVSLNKLSLDLSNPESHDWDRFSQPITWASLALDSPETLKAALKDERYRSALTSFGKNILMYAAHMNNYEAAEIALAAGVPINAVTAKQPGADSCFGIPSVMKRTALMYAAENASPEMIKLLLDNGADVTVTDSKGQGVAEYLSRNPRLVGQTDFQNVIDLVKAKSIATDWFQPSFDCKKAQSRTEKLTCANKTLAIYDRELGQAYSAILEASKSADIDRADQRAWLKLRNNTCDVGDDTQVAICLNIWNRARISYLQRR